MQLCQNCKCRTCSHFLCIYTAWLVTSRSSCLQRREHRASVTKLPLSLSHSSLCEPRDQKKAKKVAFFSFSRPSHMVQRSPLLLAIFQTRKDFLKSNNSSTADSRGNPTLQLGICKSPFNVEAHLAG